MSNGDGVADEMIRVLVLVDSATPSGPVKQLAATIAPLMQAGFRLHCIAFQRRKSEPITSTPYLAQHGATVETIFDTGPLDLTILPSVLRAVRRFRPDIVQTHGYRPSVVMALLRLSGQLQMPWIGYFHGRTAESWRVKLYDKLDHIALRMTDVTVVMSALQQREKSGYRRSRVVVLHNAIIAPEAPAQGELPEALDESLPRPVVGVIGRLSPEKGVDVLLKAWAVLTRRGHAGTLVIAGDGQERDRLETLARSLEIHSRVRFLGHLQQPDLLYSELDLLAIPSRTEGLPNVFLEALRHGVRVVSTKVGAIPDLVGSSDIARLVPIEDTALLADAIEASLNEPNGTRGSAAQALLASLSLPTRISRLVSLYDELRARRP